MSGFASRWVVSRHEPLAIADRDADDTVSEATLRRWVLAACDDYLARCPRLRALLDDPGHVAARDVKLPGALHTLEASVVVSARATELWPAACQLSVRLRAAQDAVLDASCIVSVRDRATGDEIELGDDVRDELIALEHAAQHFN